MKVFLSQPMRGRTDQQIMRERDQIFSILSSRYEDSVSEVPSFLPEQYAKHKNVPVHMLGISVQLMGDADLVVFAPGWDEARGCKIEHEICVQYKIPHVELLEEDIRGE